MVLYGAGQILGKCPCPIRSSPNQLKINAFLPFQPVNAPSKNLEAKEELKLLKFNSKECARVDDTSQSGSQ